MQFRNRKKTIRLGNVRLQTVCNGVLWACMIQIRTQCKPGSPGLDVWTDVKLTTEHDTRNIAVNSGLDWVKCKLEDTNWGLRK